MGIDGLGGMIVRERVQVSIMEGVVSCPAVARDHQRTLLVFQNRMFAVCDQ